MTLTAAGEALLPHLGSATIETREALGFCALANLEDWREGRTTRNALA